MRAADLAGLIDHTILRPDATEAMVARICAEALEHGFCSVCVNPVRVSQVAAALRGSQVRTCAVVGFPFGATTPDAKGLSGIWRIGWQRGIPRPRGDFVTSRDDQCQGYWRALRCGLRASERT